MSFICSMIEPQKICNFVVTLVFFFLESINEGMETGRNLYCSFVFCFAIINDEKLGFVSFVSGHGNRTYSCNYGGLFFTIMVIQSSFEFFVGFQEISNLILLRASLP